VFASIKIIRHSSLSTVTVFHYSTSDIPGNNKQHTPQFSVSILEKDCLAADETFGLLVLKNCENRWNPWP
jgi:hypothetical protein